MELRNYQNTDKESVSELIALMIGDDSKLEVIEGLIEQYQKYKKYCIFVLTDEKVVKGFSVVNTDPFDGSNNISEVVFLGVQEGFRGKGYGRFIANSLEQKLRRLKSRKISITVNITNIAAICFWIKMGYHFEARLKDFGSTGSDVYYFGKELF